MSVRLHYQSHECALSWVSNDEEECMEMTEWCQMGQSIYQKKHWMKKNQKKHWTKQNQKNVTTLFLLLLLLWTFELYLILSYRYEDLLISWSYLLILSLDLRSYLDLLILSSDDDPRYVSSYIITYMHSTCLWLMSFIDDQHAFYTCCCATCFYLTLDMLWTHILHVFTLRTTHGH